MEDGVASKEEVGSSLDELMPDFTAVHISLIYRRQCRCPQKPVPIEPER